MDKFGSCACQQHISSSFFFFNDTATPEISPLSLHDALPISASSDPWPWSPSLPHPRARPSTSTTPPCPCSCRSEEHTSELQSRQYLVCRLLLEKKKKKIKKISFSIMTMQTKLCEQIYVMHR